MMYMQEILQNSLTVKPKSSELWVTLSPGSQFKATDSLGKIIGYVFVGRDFEASPHGEDYWKIKNDIDHMVMSVETEWFRQRRIDPPRDPEYHLGLFAITEENSHFGTEYVQFFLPEGVDEEDVLHAMREAHERLEENTDLVDEDDSSENITMKLLDIAAEIVCGTYHYIDVDEFEYEYDWGKWNEGSEDE